MIKLNIHPTVIYRVPQFSYQSELKDCWGELKQSIAISSTDFYQQIKDIEIDQLDTMPQKLKHTVWKYFNRAKYRATPYGTFAGFGIIEKEDPSTNKLIIKNKQALHAFVDWPEKDKLEYIFQDVIDQNLHLFANSSYYLTIDSIRYLSCNEGLSELTDLEKNVDVIEILKACEKPIPINDLCENLIASGHEKAEILSLIEDMIGIQLLITERDPNIIGLDYFQRIGHLALNNSDAYHLTERESIKGDLDRGLCRHIISLLPLIKSPDPRDRNIELQKFTAKFQKKFDQREIPLMQVIDPEIGVGYGDMERDSGTKDFIVGFRKKNSEEFGFFNEFKASLDRKMKMAISPGQTIFLDEKQLKIPEKGPIMTNSCGVLITVADELISLEMTGGSTINILTGRFTLDNPTVLECARNVANSEQHANPDVLFFDIAYLIQDRLDNVNRRQLIYDYQLSILNYDTSADPLTLNDIYLSIQNNQVVLRSKKLDRRLIPRMSTAYNYTRSDLPLFRLLCDLQLQNIPPNIPLKLKNIFSDLNFYPRLQYKNIVLSPARWKLEYNRLQEMNIFSPEGLRQYFAKLNMPRHVKNGDSDMTLCFDTQTDLDMEVLIGLLEKQKNLYLDEAILPREPNIFDENGNPYIGEFILNLCHQENVYKGIASCANFKEKVEVPGFYLPGSEWLYYEIYCHPRRGDQLLVEYIRPFLKVHHQLIEKCFFIRYNENGEHIRLRILLRDLRDAYRLTSSLSVLLQPLLQHGMVSDLQFKTYKRELERYGKDLMETIETHFCLDSKYVLLLLEAQPSATEKYQLCIALLNEIKASGILNNIGIKQLIERFSNSFIKEHQLDAQGFKKLNREYKLFKETKAFIPNAQQQSAFNQLKDHFINILERCTDARKEQIMGDLIHMQVNRLFNQDQRIHEMVMYYFALKELQRQAAMKTAPVDELYIY
ncbi:MAG: thiopeptide-type bacteriocin biosynthesis protein [Pedobacter sp.]|jgi:thiopeptide-type bacteriocin biosynthesis protein|uniref:lantibiotic dehydratase n=1 Tax=Pedobacter sp. TaxID=1411316 RepID=UPI00356874BB